MLEELCGSPQWPDAGACETKERTSLLCQRPIRTATSSHAGYDERDPKARSPTQAKCEKHATAHSRRGRRLADIAHTKGGVDARAGTANLLEAILPGPQFGPSWHWSPPASLPRGQCRGRENTCRFPQRRRESESIGKVVAAQVAHVHKSKAQFTSPAASVCVFLYPILSRWWSLRCERHAMA